MKCLRLSLFISPSGPESIMTCPVGEQFREVGLFDGRNPHDGMVSARHLSRSNEMGRMKSTHCPSGGFFFTRPTASMRSLFSIAAFPPSMLTTNCSDLKVLKSSITFQPQPIEGTLTLNTHTSALWNPDYRWIPRERDKILEHVDGVGMGVASKNQQVRLTVRG